MNIFERAMQSMTEKERAAHAEVWTEIEQRGTYWAAREILSLRTEVRRLKAAAETARGQV